MACCLPGCNRAHRVEMLLECWCCCCTFTVGRECGWCAVDNTIFDLETVTPDAVRKYQLSDEELQAHFKVWPNFVANAGAGIAVGAAASEKAKKVGVCLFAWCVRVYFVFVWVCVVVVVVVLVFVWRRCTKLLSCGKRLGSTHTRLVSLLGFHLLLLISIVVPRGVAVNPNAG